jgi:hypothetical protein
VAGEAVEVKDAATVVEEVELVMPYAARRTGVVWHVVESNH